MDEAALRRGAPSANARWDNHVAILTGDFLFSKSSELTAELGADAVRIQARDLHPPRRGADPRDRRAQPGEDPLEHYLAVVAGKTGSLIATSARYGARFGGASREIEEALTSYGEIVGSAFQLSTTSSTSPPTRRVRQDPRHRPPRGRPDAPRDDGEGVHRPRRRPAARAARPRRSPTTTCTPRRSTCCARTRPWTRPARTSSPAPPRPSSSSALSPTAPSAPPSRRSPTSWPPAPPDA